MFGGIFERRKSVQRDVELGISRVIRSRGEKGKLKLLWFAGDLKEEIKHLEAHLFSLEGAFLVMFVAASLLIFTYHSIFFILSRYF